MALDNARGDTVKELAQQRGKFLDEKSELEEKIRGYQKKDKEHVARARDWDAKFKEIEVSMQDDKAEHDKLLKGKVDAERQVGKLQ